MIRRSNPASRSPRYPARWPGVIAWATGLLLVIAALGALAYLVGREEPANRGTVSAAVLHTVGQPGVATVLALAALILGLSCVRNLRLSWLAWAAIRIRVVDFKASSESVDAQELTTIFRKRLASLQLQSPSPVPGAARAADFIYVTDLEDAGFFEVLDQSRVDPGGVLGTIIRLLRATLPTHGFEVKGRLLVRPVGPALGVSVEVIRAPSERVMSDTYWGRDWDEVLLEAADGATTAILPQTRKCVAPWGKWRGLIMPPVLLHAFEEAARFERDRRYDEALQAYYRALDSDQLNLVLRLRLGQLQERVGLHLDALATYLGIASVSQQLPRLARWRERRERRHALIAANYRCSLLLGSRVAAQQWRHVPHDPPTRRDEQRRRLRSALRPVLARELTRHASPAFVDRGLAEPERERDDMTTLALRELFASLALHRLRQLRRRLRWASVGHGTILTPATVHLTEIRIQLRLTYLRRQRGDAVAWPPSPVELTRMIERVERGGPLLRATRRPFRTWHENYNAACVYALPLLSPELDLDREAQLARLAVARLNRATEFADSGYVASRRDWILSEDPDLDGLRSRSEFRHFEVMLGGSTGPVPRRPARVQQLESSRYVRALLVQTAFTWRAAWSARGETPAPQLAATTLVEWFQDDARSWDHVAAVTRDYRHAGTRLGLIGHVRACQQRYRFPSQIVPFPRYGREPLNRPPRESLDEGAVEEIAFADLLLRRLRSILVGDDDHPGMLADLDRWSVALHHREALSRASSPYMLAQLCHAHAALWQALGEWLLADTEAQADAERGFLAQRARAAQLWSVTLPWWQAVVERIAVTSNGAQEPFRAVPLIRASVRSAWWHMRIAKGDRQLERSAATSLDGQHEHEGDVYLVRRVD